MEPFEIIERNNLKLEISLDGDSENFNPRDWDNLGTMICFHRRYNLGDKHNYNADDFESYEDQKQFFIKHRDACVILPLYLYDHSGITMSTGPFSCGWDSGQVGWIFVDKASVRKEFGIKNITKSVLETVTKILEQEVKTYDLYIMGEIYEFIITDGDGDVIDSCGGFFGIDEARTAGLEALETLDKTQVILA